MKKKSILVLLLFCFTSFGQNKLDKSKSQLNSESNKKVQNSSSYSSAAGTSKSSFSYNIIVSRHYKETQ